MLPCLIEWKKLYHLKGTKKMGVITKTEERRVIPRWRSFELATLAGEIQFTQKNDSVITYEGPSLLKEQTSAWEVKKDIPHAGDLLSSAYVLGIESQYIDVANFVLQKEKNNTTPLYKLAMKISGKENDDKSTVEIADILISQNFESHNKEIRKFRSYLKQESKNPIAWIELGRIYSVMGLVEKAKRCIETALSLDKNNRFIVRSASRFYQHFHDEEYALQVIKRSSFVNSDPWLISAEVAYSSLLKRHSKLAKLGINYLKDDKFKSLSITELASSIATLEYSNGKHKEAKRLFEKSLIHPNDNSLAQVNWISDDLPGISVDMSRYSDLPLTFEAKALNNYHKKDFKKSYFHALRWFEDEPYSTRPINFASYVSGIFLDNYGEAVNLIRKGLVANPNDPMLINNLIYFLLEDEKEDEAFRSFNTYFHSFLKTNFENLKDSAKITLIATTGLVLFRSGEVERGRLFYQKSIELARKSKSKYLIALALAHYIREELKIADNPSELNSWKNQLDATCKNLDEPDLKIIYDKTSSEYERKLKALKH